jgi:hypothetical protein
VMPVTASVRLARVAGNSGAVQFHVEDDASGETIFQALFNAEEFASLKRGTTVSVAGTFTAHHERVGHDMTVNFYNVPPEVVAKRRRDVTISVIEWFQTQPAYVTAHEFAIEENDGVWRVAAREWEGLELVEEDVEDEVDTAEATD